MDLLFLLFHLVPTGGMLLRSTLHIARQLLRMSRSINITLGSITGSSTIVIPSISIISCSQVVCHFERVLVSKSLTGSDCALRIASNPMRARIEPSYLELLAKGAKA